MSGKAEPSKSEISTVFGRCRCCLEYGYMKNMWGEYYSGGEREIYGEMLMETFSIAWEATSDSKARICEGCVSRLRDASNFKREVLASENALQDDSDGEYEMDDSQDVWYKYEEDGGSADGDLEEGEEGEEMKYEIEELELEGEVKPEPLEYEEVEYLEEYAPEGDDTSSQEAAPAPAARGPDARGRWPRKKRPDEIIKPYKNYSADDMRKAIEAVQSGRLSISEASKLHNVPRKTVAAKLHSLRHKRLDTPESQLKQQTQDNQYNFVEEVKKVLSYTTAVPFKIKTSRYFCAYCYTSLDAFDQPSALRAHTKHHDHEMRTHIDRILRPQFQNEILRVDIEDFECKVCSTAIPTWNDMFQHMSEAHSIEFDQVYTRLIPYKLTGDKVFCALCCTEFPNFQFLDAHMNAHYCNYMCSDCGDTFVTEVRLKHHQLIHNIGRHPCRYCGKVFSLEKYKKKHEGMVHNEYKMFKCSDCGEKFHKEYERHLHIVKAHPERVRISTCELCGKVFDWRPYYLAHLRKAHSKVKKNECQYCKKRFVTKHEVKMHEMRHTGEGRHLCVFCGKNFVTPTELRKHSKKHLKDIHEIQEIQIVRTQS